MALVLCDNAWNIIVFVSAKDFTFAIVCERTGHLAIRDGWRMRSFSHFFTEQKLVSVQCSIFLLWH